MDNDSKGILYTILSQFTSLTYWLFGPLALAAFSTETVTTLWFGTAAVLSFIIIAAYGKLKHYVTLLTHTRWILLMGLLNALSILTAWEGLRHLGPQLTSFVSHVEILFVVLASVIFLGEKLSLKEWLFGILVIIGVGVISYSPGEYVAYGVLLLVVHAVFFTAARYIIKSKLHDVDHMLIANYRALFVSLFIFVYALLLGRFELSWNIALLYSTVPSLGSAVLGHILTFAAYKHLHIGKVQLIGAFGPLLVLLAAYLFFGDTMTPQQLLGGLFILMGVIGLVYFHKKRKLYKRASNPPGYKRLRG